MQSTNIVSKSWEFDHDQTAINGTTTQLHRKVDGMEFGSVIFSLIFKRIDGLI
jgi:hypothetical protein